LEKFGVEMIGASLNAIKRPKTGNRFRNAMNRIGLRMP
jgi:carbamoylphosphate synthase large subunit